jgi:hypothetical protein
MLENELCQLSACLGIDRIGRSIRFYFPEQKCNIQIPEIRKEEDDFEPLIEQLRRRYDEEWSDKMLRAYILHWAKQNEIKMNGTQLMAIGYQIIYEYHFGNEESPKPKIDYRDIIIQNEVLGIKWDDLARKYDIPRTTLYDNCNRLKNRLLTLSQCKE